MSSQTPPPVPSPPAPDQTDRLILQVAEAEAGLGSAGDVIVIDDETGALVAGALAVGETARVHAWQSSRLRAEALHEMFAADVASGRLRIAGLPDAAGEAVPADLVELAEGAPAAGTVLLRLPKSLAALDARARDLAAAAQRTGREDQTLVGGARVKHMTRTQNSVLEESFAQVHATLGLAKSRGLVASGPRGDVGRARTEAGAAHVPVRGVDTELGLRSVGGVFSGTAADAGSLLLLHALDAALEAGEIGEPMAELVDLGCGNGLLSAYLAAALPAARIRASDEDLDAVASTLATLSAHGIEAVPAAAATGASVSWEASLADTEDGSADLVLLNPPFHDGTTLDPTLVQGLLDAAGRVLRPGGELWFVHNSHLRYRPEVERRVGETEQRARDRRFTVLRAIRS